MSQTVVLFCSSDNTMDVGQQVGRRRSTISGRIAPIPALH